MKSSRDYGSYQLTLAGKFVDASSNSISSSDSFSTTISISIDSAIFANVSNNFFDVDSVALYGGGKFVVNRNVFVDHYGSLRFTATGDVDARYNWWPKKSLPPPFLSTTESDIAIQSAFFVRLSLTASGSLSSLKLTQFLVVDVFPMVY